MASLIGTLLALASFSSDCFCVIVVQKIGVHFLSFFNNNNNNNKIRCIWSSKTTLSERAIQSVVESKCMLVKATVIGSHAKLCYSRNSCSEGWMRSCLENQLAEEVWASEKCSSIGGFGKHFTGVFSAKKLAHVLHSNYVT